MTLEVHGGPYARVIADSVSPRGSRISSLELRMHPSAVEHFLTHCSFARNGASRRAIPLGKQIEAVLTDPAVPLSWGRERKGMKGGDRLPDPVIDVLTRRWQIHLRDACNLAQRMGEMGLHKEAASRVLAPFGWRTYIVTADEAAWDNFFWQRIDDGAQDEIRAVAVLAQDALVDSEPRLIEAGQWHLPYMDDLEVQAAGTLASCISAARCARVSYLTQDGRRDFNADIELYDRLITGGHWSPFEHVATPSSAEAWVPGKLHGWAQLRHQLERPRHLVAP